MDREIPGYMKGTAMLTRSMYTELVNTHVKDGGVRALLLAHEFALREAANDVKREKQRADYYMNKAHQMEHAL